MEDFGDGGAGEAFRVGCAREGEGGLAVVGFVGCESIVDVSWGVQAEPGVAVVVVVLMRVILSRAGS